MPEYAQVGRFGPAVVAGTIPGTTVTVRATAGRTRLFGSPDPRGSEVGPEVQVGRDGTVSFYAAPGTYELRWYGGGSATVTVTGGVVAPPTFSGGGGGGGGSVDLSGYLTAAAAAATYEPLSQAVSEQQVQAMIDVSVAAEAAARNAAITAATPPPPPAPAVVGPSPSGFTSNNGGAGQTETFAQGFTLTEPMTVEQIGGTFGPAAAGTFDVGIAVSLGSTVAGVSFYSDGSHVALLSGASAPSAGGDTAYALPSPVTLPAGDYFVVARAATGNGAYAWAYNSGSPTCVGAVSGRGAGYSYPSGSGWAALRTDVFGVIRLLHG